MTIIKKLKIEIDWYELKKLYLTTEQIKEMANAGVVFGSHGEHHTSVSELSAQIMLESIRRSKDVIERTTGKRCSTYAFPFGEYNSSPGMIDLLASMGIKTSFILQNDLNVKFLSNKPVSRLLVTNTKPHFLYFKMNVAQIIK
jgi:peptidoglycan/xylan/chitin deacetylase (PgdA/CDA1 family)